METNNTKDEVIKSKILADEISYQEKSIVSKQIIKKPNGNVTLFAFGKDESLTEHTSPYEALVFIVDGKMEIKIAGKPVIVNANEIILLPANVPHGLIAVENSKMLLTMIK
jgi:quercetin dioxygenase-like cupin family protein